jgi:hypothetical protein
MPLVRFLRTRWIELATSARRDLPYAVCALLAIVAVWGHRYPAGIDLPQHANLFRLWADLSNGPLEYRSLYRVDAFTPYLLAYAVAYPLTMAFGAVVAMKCLLTLVALGTPLMMRRWLRVVGAHEEFALFGFLLAFDFQYHWGFLSHSAAIPLMFGYLAAFQCQGMRPGWRTTLRPSLYGVALFFCHGITFGVCMVTTAISLVLQRRPLKAWRRALHVVPLAAIALLWLALRKNQTTESPSHDWFVTWDRLTTLFAGPFLAQASRQWARVSGAAILVLLVVTRPRLVLQVRRSVPLVFSLACFLVLPETLAATWLIASRFCVFVHAFAPAVVKFHRTDWLRRQSGRVAFALVAAGLVLLNVRLYDFNKELAGLRDLAAHMQPGADVRNLMPDTSPHSEVFGAMQFGQVPAWITADQGGILDNDSAYYYQIPVKRNNVPFPSRHRYIIARGEVARATSIVTSRVKDARLIYQSSPWLLFENRLTEGGDFTVVRSAQSWRQLNLDRGVSGSPLSIAGVSYQHGLGTHADSFIRLRLDRAGRSFTGACGIDDQERARGQALFRIRDSSGEVLFESGEVLGGEPARRFSVILEGRKELLLEVRKVLSTDYAHADWVDLRVQGTP